MKSNNLFTWLAIISFGFSLQAMQNEYSIGLNYTTEPEDVRELNRLIDIVQTESDLARVNGDTDTDDKILTFLAEITIGDFTIPEFEKIRTAVDKRDWDFLVDFFKEWKKKYYGY